MPRATINTERIEKAIEKEIRKLARNLAKDMLAVALEEYKAALQVQVLDKVDTILDEAFPDEVV